MDQPEPDPPRTCAYRVREIAALLNVDDSTVYRWIGKGTLRAHRFEDSIRVDPADFEAFKRNSVIQPEGQSPTPATCCRAVALPEGR